MIFDQWFVIEYGYSEVISGILQNGSADVFDPTGYWYDDSSYHLDNTGEIKVTDFLYGLNIYTFRNGVICGTYGSSHFSGIYNYDNLQFSTVLSDWTAVNFFGSFQRPYPGRLYYRILSCRRGCSKLCRLPEQRSECQLPLPRNSTEKQLTSPDGFSFQYYNGQKYALRGTDIILSQNGCSRFIVGTIEQEVDGKLVTKQVIGMNITLSSMQNERAILIDDTSITYSVSLSQGLLEMDFVDYSDSGDCMAASTRIYTYDGSVPTMPIFYVTTDKTWAAKGIQTMKSDGTTGSFGQMTLTVTSQYRNAFAGTATIDGTEYSIIGCLGINNQYIHAEISFLDYHGLIAVESCFINPTNGTFTILGDTDGREYPTTYVAELMQQ